MTVTFPLIAPAIISGMLLSFIVMLGIYGIPAVLGTPGDIPVLTTYIFKLTAWSPPLYIDRGRGRDHPDGGDRLPGVAAAAWCCRGAATSPSPARRSGRRVINLGRWRYFTLGLAVVYLFIVVVLPTLALIVAAFRKFMFIRDLASLFDARQYSLIHFERLFDNPLACARSSTPWRSA